MKLPGPAGKRQRTPMEELRAWADEWPIKKDVVGILEQWRNGSWFDQYMFVAMCIGKK